ncbi:hypothetical protein EWW49_12915 [Pseudomonas syringae]|uniref:hypothetical protein n=1 Tax=Pseudomonas sp. MWU16-30316 TaxID=2878093 RepID=UPI001105646A|nr:hypothetical protein [Pseudomonas sp. MWU16-30316]TFZ36204.1 hypothetical protein EWW49_12915 [Pseudomonas syringae]
MSLRRKLGGVLPEGATTSESATEIASKEFFELCKLEAITSPFETSSKFDVGHSDNNLSPIDLFITNTKQLNKLVTSDYSPVLGNLILLGYVSAAESYIRALIRKLIHCDEYISALVSEKSVSYAAALHHKKEILPEALLEDFSLASPYNVFETLKELIGMKGNRPNPLILPSQEFKKVCELRHCCVHRFGKLGSKNAIRLGLAAHTKSLEKPILLLAEDVDKIAFIVDNFVRSINNYVFKFLLERSVKNRDDSGGVCYEAEWLWVYAKDKKRFSKYYKIFSSKEDVYKSMTLRAAYEKFYSALKPEIANLPERKPKGQKRNTSQDANNV